MVGKFLDDNNANNADLHDAESDCKICAKGQYADSVASSSCTSCTAGRALADDATNETLHDDASDCNIVCNAAT